MSQTNYNEQAVAFAGLLAEGFEPNLKVSALQGEVSAEIPFGYFVKQSTPPVAGGPTPTIVALPSAGTDDIAGCVIHSHDYDKRLDLGDTGVKPKRILNLLRKGRIWAMADKAVTFDDEVYVRYTAAGSQLVGMLSDSADSNKCLQLFGARFITETTALGLVLVEFDLSAHFAIKQNA